MISDQLSIYHFVEPDETRTMYKIKVQYSTIRWLPTSLTNQKFPLNKNPRKKKNKKIWAEPNGLYTMVLCESCVGDIRLSPLAAFVRRVDRMYPVGHLMIRLESLRQNLSEQKL